ncbi:MAG: TlyA family rRNA (cytidine-2'-O)-methyltransferase [Opitutae bacterium]|nr:TlyA family rRNA (cytidine-2'-O)-methyltransferase [Opitutae bacterium]
MKIKRKRADELIHELGLCESRTQAKALIIGGKVWIGSERVEKPGRLLHEDAKVRVETPPPYVGRGGEKLRGFLDEFPLPMEGVDVLDLGASTGGFTDCLLQAGAKSSTCLDVGHGQLHYKLRQDKRVTNIERTNLRSVQPGDLPMDQYPIIVMDLSFISLRKVISTAWVFLCGGGHLIALAKPQFEATKEEADRGKGVIRDEEVRTRVLIEIKTFVAENLSDAQLFAESESPLRGAEGNTEYFLGWKKSRK